MITVFPQIVAYILGGVSVYLIVKAALPAKKFAVIVSGTRGITNYHNQADAFSIYNSLIHQGFEAGNIILMAFDDVSNSPLNPFEGKVYSRPGCNDVYADVSIDYKGNNVNWKVLKAVLEGKITFLAEHGSGRAINPGSKDSVMFVLSTSGRDFMIAIGPDLITADMLHNALKTLSDRSGSIFVVVAACGSGSLFTKRWNPPDNALVLASAPSLNEGCNAEYPTTKNFYLASRMLSAVSEHINTVDPNLEPVGNLAISVEALAVNGRAASYGSVPLTTKPLSDFVSGKKATTITLTQCSTKFVLKSGIAPPSDCTRLVPHSYQFPNLVGKKAVTRLFFELYLDKKNKLENIFTLLKEKFGDCSITNCIIEMHPSVLKCMRNFHELFEPHYGWLSSPFQFKDYSDEIGVLCMSGHDFNEMKLAVIMASIGTF